MNSPTRRKNMIKKKRKLHIVKGRRRKPKEPPTFRKQFKRWCKEKQPVPNLKSLLIIMLTFLMVFVLSGWILRVNHFMLYGY